MTVRAPTAPEELALVLFDEGTGILQRGTSNATPSSTLSLGQKLFSLLIHKFPQFYTHQLLKTIILFILGSISFVQLVIGLEMMDSTGLPDSVSPTVMHFFKYSLVIITSHSLAQGNVSPRLYKISITRKSRFFSWWGIPLSRFLNLSYGWYTNHIAYYTVEVVWILGGFIGQGEQGWLANLCIYSLMQIILLPIGVRVNLSSDLVMAISILTSICAASSELVHSNSLASVVPCLMDKRIRRLLPVAAAQINNFLKILKEKKVGKFIRYAVGLVGTALFQNFFHINTLDEVRVFLYLATTWVANLTITNTSHDFGIFNFILGNVILGSTVNQSGLGITTWLTCSACLLLYLLRLSLRSLMTSKSKETLLQPLLLFLIFYSCVVFDSLHNLLHKT